MEQSVRLTPIPITGSAEPKDNAFSKTFLYRPADKNLHARRGELYACLSLASPDPSLDLENLANQILTCLSDDYFSQKQGSVLDALSQAVEKAQARSLELTRREGGQIPLDFSLVAASIWGKAAFVGLVGGGFLALFRGGELLAETTNRLFSEELKDKDVLVLATPLFAVRVGEEKIAEILRQVSPQEWKEKFREIISPKEEAGRMSALFLQVEIEEVPGEEEVIEILEVPKQEPIYTPLLYLLQRFISKCKIPARRSPPVTDEGGSNAKYLPAEALAKAGQISKIGSTLKNFAFLIFNFVFRRGEAEPAVYLKEQKPSDRGKRFALVGALIILLIVSVFGSRWWNKRTERKKEAQNLLAQVQEKISESEKAITSNPDKTKKLLEEAKDALGKVKGMQIAKKDIEGLETKMEEILEKTYNTQKVKPTLIADLNLKIEGGNFQEIIKLGEKLYSLDTAGGKIVEVNLENENQIEILSTTNHQPARRSFSEGGPPTTNQFLAGYLDFLYIFDPKQGIIEINRRTGASEAVIPTDLNWKEITGLETFLGNLYLLDPPGNRIFKYIAVETGFSKFFDYFSQNVNLSGVKSFTIDGAIYLLFNDGRVEKYLGGAREEFNLSGLYPPLSDASQIYTNPDAEKLYFVPENFILIFGKNGLYEKRLQIEEVSKIKDLVVEEKQGKIWLLSDGKIYEAGL